MSRLSRDAAGILQAWQSGDRDRLNASLAGAASLEPTGDSAERERTELLAGIAAGLQEMLASGRTEDSPASLDLLRHLARPRQTAFYAN
jgi:hypothetical protein